MTDNQLYLAIGIPAIFAMLGVGANILLYTHLSSVMNSRFDAVDRRFESLESKMNTRFDSVERRLELIQGELHQHDMRITKLER